jgi:transcriptional regulator with XRE-family HTH domain
MRFNEQRFNELIDSSGLSQGEIDKRMGVASGLTSKYTRGVRNPSPYQLYRFFDAIGLTAEQVEAERLVDWFIPNGSD